MIIIFPETSRLSSFFARPRRGEFAYATNQGQHNVIEKFRNSAIMCEYPGYRPGEVLRAPLALAGGCCFRCFRPSPLR